MAKTIVGLFDRFDVAKEALDELIRAGFSRQDISVVSRQDLHPGEERPASEAGMALQTPGVSLAAPGELVEPLQNLGVPEEEARWYDQAVYTGGTLVAMITEDPRAPEAAGILNHHGVVDIRRRAGEMGLLSTAGAQPGEPVRIPVAGGKSDEWHQPVRRKDTALAAPSTSHKGERDEEVWDKDFRTNWSSAFAGTGRPYEDYASAYHYGYDLARDHRYRRCEWNSVESEARHRWEQDHPGTWERVKEAVRYSWERVREKV